MPPMLHDHTSWACLTIQLHEVVMFLEIHVRIYKITY
jgi:hypothetical protein